MPEPPFHPISELRAKWRAGDEESLRLLVPLVYKELRRLAHCHLRKERPNHTLQTTALVHEAFMRLLGQEQIAWQGRAHFFGIAAKLMRRILVDHAREHQAKKRQGAAIRVALDDDVASVPSADCELLSLDLDETLILVAARAGCQRIRCRV